MHSVSRRRFISQSGQAALAGTVIFAPHQKEEGAMKNIFVHHVYFWLKNPGSSEDTAGLLEGLHLLATVPGIKSYHIGKPAGTDRDVIDRSYAFSWLALFNNKDDQDRYQVDPIHLRFVKEYSHLWERVVVYDSVDA